MYRLHAFAIVAIALNLACTRIAAAEDKQTFRFAFSGQVVDAETGRPIPAFSADIVGQFPSINSVINPMGHRDGYFHISRTPSSRETVRPRVPVVVVAQGYQPIVQLLELGGDCIAAQCASVDPLVFEMERVESEVMQVSADVIPVGPQMNLNDPGFLTTLFALASAGKIDGSAYQALITTRPDQKMHNILVILNGVAGSQINGNVAGLMGLVPSDKFNGLPKDIIGILIAIAPYIAQISPEIGAIMMAISMILPYLQPLIPDLAQGKGGWMGVLASGMVGGSGLYSNLAQLLAVFLQSQNISAQQIIALMIPLIRDILTKLNTNRTSYSGVVPAALANPVFFKQLQGTNTVASGPVDPNLLLLLTYLQPLIQAFQSKDGAALLKLFNQLIASGGLDALKGLFKNPKALDQFAKLLPYIEALVKALNSGNSAAIAQALIPLITQKNPGNALIGLIPKNAGPGAELIAQILFPAIASILGQTVPGKQAFSAQLLQGLMNGYLKGIEVTHDFNGLPAVVVSGRAADIFRLVQLPNVQQVIAVDHLE